VVSPERGSALFIKVGCAACHAEGTLDVRGKWNLFHLMDFLQDPLTVRPDGRMPDLLLQDFEAADLAAYLLEFPRTNLRDDKAPSAPAHDAELAEIGKTLFASVGCANCHDVGVASSLNAKPLADLPAGLPCTVSDYGPTPVLDLTHLKAATPEQHTLALMGGLQCQACHAREGLDPTLQLNAHRHFTGDPSLADAGRAPPGLDQFEQKLQPSWIAGIVGSREHRLRGYLNTRMPNFGPRNAAQLVAGLATPPPVARSATKLEDGRHLVGASGMRCITCHDLGSWKSMGIPGINLAHIDRRLQPSWFATYLADPAAYRLGTLMPAFWPKGVSSRPDILDGSTSQQVSAIWDYLSHPDIQPEGYPPEQGAFEIVPSDRPIVMRTFMKHTGTHALAIGFPGGLNLVYDTRTCQITELWKGTFLDGYSTWFVRFTPPVEPLGTDHVRIKKGEAGGQVFAGYQVGGQSVTLMHRDGSALVLSVEGGRLWVRAGERWVVPVGEGVTFKRIKKREHVPALQKGVLYEVNW
ncbi:MAG: hypothetical protein ACI9TH_004386, partial [Kiritimatiellia bacterium]